MCRVAKVLLIAPTERQTELGRTLSSLEYDIVAAVTSAEEAAAITADAAVVWEPGAATIAVLRERGVKTAAITMEEVGADMHLAPDDVPQFKTRIWELFAPG